MENQETGYLSPEIGGGVKKPQATKRKNQEKPGGKPETRPHFSSLEAWHEYNKRTRETRLTNDLVQANGDYNPNYLDWLEDQLTGCALALCEILTHDPIENRGGYIAVWKDTAQELITDMQYYVSKFREDNTDLTTALEYCNLYLDFIKFKGLKSEFDKFMCYR